MANARHPSTFHHQLDEVSDDLVRLAALVTEAIPRGTEALLDGDLAGAAGRSSRPTTSSTRSPSTSRSGATTLLALQQPMASDLRASSPRIRLHLRDRALRRPDGQHRQGRPAASTARPFRPRLRGLIQPMSDEAVRLFRLAIDAYAERDAALAAALDDMDDRLDDLHRDYIQALRGARAPTCLDVQAAVQLALIGRYYERIGDHAVNIGERVQYMVTGWLPEHTGAARIGAPRVIPGGALPSTRGAVAIRPGRRSARPAPRRFERRPPAPRPARSWGHRRSAAIGPALCRAGRDPGDPGGASACGRPSPAWAWRGLHGRGAPGQRGRGDPAGVAASSTYDGGIAYGDAGRRATSRCSSPRPSTR